MDYLWTPWRYQYVTNAGKAGGCIFCDACADPDERKTFVIHRGQACLVMLNAFPYTSGHVMIAPCDHVDQFDRLAPAAAAEMMQLMQRVESALRSAYSPHGINFGMNLGRAAGAGIADHIHMHALPRWFGDTSFITTTSETRVLPEALEVTWERLRAALGASFETSPG